MTEKELINTIGGASIPSAALINAISRGIETLYDLGRSFGTEIKMLIKGKRCN